MKIINLYSRFFKAEYNTCKNTSSRNITSACLMLTICQRKIRPLSQRSCWIRTPPQTALRFGGRTFHNCRRGHTHGGPVASPPLSKQKYTVIYTTLYNKYQYWYSVIEGVHMGALKPGSGYQYINTLLYIQHYMNTGI